MKIELGLNNYFYVNYGFWSDPRDCLLLIDLALAIAAASFFGLIPERFWFQSCKVFGNPARFGKPCRYEIYLGFKSYKVLETLQDITRAKKDTAERATP